MARSSLPLSFLPTFPGLLQYGDPFLAPDFYNLLLEALNIIYGNIKLIFSVSHPVLGLLVFKYDEIMILFLQMQRVLWREDEYRTAGLEKQH